MKSVQKTSVLRKLRNAEHFQIHWAMSQFLVEPVADFTELTAAFAQYKQLFQHEDVVFKHRSKMVGTQAVIAADRKRDDEFIMLRMIVKSALRSIDLEIKAAAEILMPVIDDYREVPYKSYNEATALVTNLVQDLRSTENQSAVTKMELTAAIDLLSEANEAFQTVFYQRNRWVENRKQQGNMEMIRPQVDEAFDVVVNIINSAYTMNEVGAKDADKREKLTVMIDEINQQLSNMIRAIAYRQ
ncbi:DUF6261 family protein, partial [Parabacteroides sp. OttesenSCG-928-G21]|nr:DUF6261 family protein [Parabacteroides sp. OttesenSCG-928-G21]